MPLVGPLFTGHLERRTAKFSACRRYRYYLAIEWDPIKPDMVFLMLNPSTADEAANDPTVERCERRARVDARYGGVAILNLFAWRATDPRVDDPVGPLNDEIITAMCGMSVVCGWGRHGRLRFRDDHVLALLKRHHTQPLCLAVNSDGTPKHPLYVAYSVTPRPLPERPR